MNTITRRIIAAIGVSCWLWSAAAAADDQPQPFTWQTGPHDVTLGTQATLSLPAGYQFLGPQESVRLLRAMGNVPSGNELAIVTSTAEDSNWFVVVRFINAGYVKDDEADNWNADEMLTAIREGTDEDNHARQQAGVPPLNIRGWEEKPRYDKAANKVVWAISAQSEQDVSVNYNTLALGREGYMSMNMVGDLDHLANLKPHTDVLLSHLNFVNGKRYADFNSATDKVAAVGLSALIAGAAFKSGLLAKIWGLIVPLLIALKKVIVFLVIGIGAWLTKLWKKRGSGDPSQEPNA
ncbi:MAG: DUF2167 domain-containing protein [Nitrospira sp.]|nr:DUF2167 domain-containing protein [Nitrospira sp.]